MNNEKNSYIVKEKMIDKPTKSKPTEKQLISLLWYFREVDKIFSILDTYRWENPENPQKQIIALSDALFWSDISGLLENYLFNTRPDNKFVFSIDVKWDGEMLNILWWFFDKVEHIEKWFQVTRNLPKSDAISDNKFVKFCKIMKLVQ